MGQSNRIRSRANGPLLCSGHVEVRTAGGALLTRSDDVALCRCGVSCNWPFCDGSHRRTGFQHDAQCDVIQSVEFQGEGTLLVVLYEHGGIAVRGPVTIEYADGSRVTRSGASFCRCRHAASRLWCDTGDQACHRGD